MPSTNNPFEQFDYYWSFEYFDYRTITQNNCGKPEVDLSLETAPFFYQPSLYQEGSTPLIFRVILWDQKKVPTVAQRPQNSTSKVLNPPDAAYFSVIIGNSTSQHRKPLGQSCKVCLYMFIKDLFKDLVYKRWDDCSAH